MLAFDVFKSTGIWLIIGRGMCTCPTLGVPMIRIIVVFSITIFMVTINIIVIISIMFGLY